MMRISPQDLTADPYLGRDEEFLLPVYPRFPVVMDHGEGVYLVDTQGRRYLDLMAGLGVNALGHAHPRMVEVFREQSAKLVHVSPLYGNRYGGELAERLCQLSGLAGVFYSTGGSEAVEGALKLARTVALHGYGAGKHEIVSLRASYHGRTYGSMSVTGQEKYREDFEPGLPGTKFCRRNNIAELRAVVSDATCAILIEPVMGEGGIYECSTEFLAEARRLADAHHAVLIFDEIQSGLGRTGQWFAFQEHGIQPDILILGKPLGGGIPLSAIVVSRELFHGFGLSRHGSTLGGSPLACRLGVEFLDVIEEERLLEQVRSSGVRLRKGLLQLAEDLEIVCEARGYGLLQGLELNEPGRPVVEAGMERGLLLNCIQGKILRFLPPFLLDVEHVDLALAGLRAVLEEIQAKSETNGRMLVPVAKG